MPNTFQNSLPSKNNTIIITLCTLLVISTGLGIIGLSWKGIGNLRLWMFLLLIIVIVLYLNNCIKKRFVPLISSTLLYVLGYFAAVLLSGFNAIDNTLWLQRVFLILAMLLLFFIFSQRSNQQEFNLYLKTIVCSGIIFASLAIVEIYIFLKAPEVYGIIHYFDTARQFVDKSNIHLVLYYLIPRARGFYVEPNEFSQYLMLPFGFLLAVTFFRHQKMKWTVIYIIGISIVLFAQLFSLSRGGLFGFLGQFLGLLLIRKVSGVQWAVDVKYILSIALVFHAFLIGSCICIGWDIMLLFNTIAGRVISTVTKGNWAYEIRLTTVQDGFVSVGTSFKNFLVGVGAGNLDVSYVREATTTNQFVDILVETGIIGLTFYVAMILSLLWLSNKFMRNRLLSSNNELFVVFAGAYLSFLGMLFGGLTYSTHALFFFWLNAGLLLAISKYGLRFKEVS